MVKRGGIVTPGRHKNDIFGGSLRKKSHSFGGSITKKKRRVIEKLDDQFTMRQQYGLPSRNLHNLTKQLKKMTKKGIWQPQPNSRMNTMSDFIKAPIPERNDNFAKNFLHTVRGYTNLSRYVKNTTQNNNRTGKLLPLDATNRDTYKEWMGQGNHPILTEVAEYAGFPSSI